MSGEVGVRASYFLSRGSETSSSACGGILLSGGYHEMDIDVDEEDAEVEDVFFTIMAHIPLLKPQAIYLITNTLIQTTIDQPCQHQHLEILFSKRDAGEHKSGFHGNMVGLSEKMAKIGDKEKNVNCAEPPIVSDFEILWGEWGYIEIKS